MMHLKLTRVRLELTAWSAVTFLLGYLAMLGVLAVVQVPVLVGAWALWMAFPTAWEPLGRAVGVGFDLFRHWVTYGAVTARDMARDRPVVIWASRMGAVSAFLMVTALEIGVRMQSGGLN